MFTDIDIFVETKVLSKWYAFIIGVLICCSVMLFYRKRTVTVDKQSIVILFFFAYLLIRGLISDRTATIDYLIPCSFLLLYLFYKFGHYQQQYVDLIIVIVCISQALYAIFQFTGTIYSNGSFKTLGSFDNPAGLAACLSVGFPLVFTLLKLNKLSKLLSLVGILVIGLAIVLSESRAGITSVAIISIIYACNHLPIKLNKKRYLIFLLTFLGCIVFFYLLLLKPDSALGRILIWKSSLALFKDNLVFGGGAGSFLAHYMVEQANYFIQYPESRFAILADNVLHPFNEYLLLVIEYGMIGFILLIICVVLFLKSSKPFSPYILCLVSLGIFSLFSYPLKYPFTWVIAAYSIAQISRNNEILKVIKFQKKLFNGFILTLIGVALIFLIRDIKFEYQWNKVAHRSLSGATVEMIHQYKKLFRSWNSNHLFLYNYGAELNYVKEYEKSIDILNQCVQHWNDYDIQMILADNYFNLEKLDEAEKHYKLAFNMCPNRFVPLYKLHKIYLKKNKEVEALDIAHNITDKKIKIPSATVDFIKSKMKQFILKNSN